MDRRKLLLLLGALVIAIVTALAARSMFADAAAPQAQAQATAPKPAKPEGPRVLVAQRSLPVGTILTADAVAYQPWPEEMVNDAYFVTGASDLNKLLGTVVRHPVTAGEPLTRGVLVRPGDSGFLAAALGPGMRAVTVPVSAKTGVGGFVFPGDKVDLVLTQTVNTEGGEPVKASETILKNLRVLATDQSTETTHTPDGKTMVRAFRTVTLEVTPRIAEKVAVAQTIGTLSLSLRSIADNAVELERAIASGAINIPNGISKAEEDMLLASALNRPVDGATTFVTGGDVSRFQRRPAPPKPPASAGPAAPKAPPPPTVRVTRGQSTTSVRVGRGTSALLEEEREGLDDAARVLPAAGATLVF
jgi:pilus assembly protein CpaB